MASLTVEPALRQPQCPSQQLQALGVQGHSGRGVTPTPTRSTWSALAVTERDREETPDTERVAAHSFLW